jgi:hypothetical protein
VVVEVVEGSTGRWSSPGDVDDPVVAVGRGLTTVVPGVSGRGGVGGVPGSVLGDLGGLRGLGGGVALVVAAGGEEQRR